MVVATKKTGKKKVPVRKAPAQKAPLKKLGLESSVTRSALLDATEKLIREQGFGAITSRIIAAKAGLKPQLIHYYFNSVDDLYIEVLRRGVEADHARRAAAMEAADEPLRALWMQSNDPKSARFVTEFMALANHNPAVRAEIALVAEKQRAHQVEIVTQYFASRSVTPSIPPIVSAVLIECVARGVALESGLDIVLGHDEMDVFVEGCLQWFEKTGSGGRTARSTRRGKTEIAAEKIPARSPKRAVNR